MTAYRGGQAEAGQAADRPDAEALLDRLFRCSIGVFLMGGFLSATVSLLVPHLRLTLHLDYADALLVQFAFHTSYLLFALPVMFAVRRLGYMRAIASGLLVMALGCLTLAAAQQMARFAAILVALLILSGGITVLQIASNTVVAITGVPRRATARLIFLQGFNSFGTVMGPLLAAPLLLSASAVAVGGPVLAATAFPFLAAAPVLFGLALLFVSNRDLLPPAPSAPAPPARALLGASFKDNRLVGGVLAIFLYVGAEVTIGALLTDFLMLPDRLAATPVNAGRLVSLYWVGAMVGRFAGAFLMRWMDGARLLRHAATGAVGLALGAVLMPGIAGAVALLAVGICNSVMYPTIYALALPRDPALSPVGATWLCMAVVGGAAVPVATGVLADLVGLPRALSLPALCYAGIAVYTIWLSSPAGNAGSARP